MDETQVIDTPVDTTVETQVETPVNTAEEITPLDLVRDSMSDDPQYERGPDGKFVKKTPKEEVQDPLKKPEAKEEGLPEGASPQTQERFQKVIATLKEKEAEVSTVKAQLDEATQTISNLTQTLQSHGVDEQVFRDLLTYAKAVRGGDVQNWYQMLTNQVRQFELATGRQFAGTNPLGQYPDLDQAVKAGQIAPEYAMQLANERDKNRMMGNSFQAQQQQHLQSQRQQQEQQQAQQAIESGVKAVADLVTKWKSSDIDWTLKGQKVAAYAEKIASNPHVPPEAYADLVTAFYENLQVSAPRQSSNITPLRPASASTGPAVPQSPLDAVRMAVARS